MDDSVIEQAQQSAEEQESSVIDAVPEIRPLADGDDQNDPVVVGIGASAGGLDAFKQFFAATTIDSKLAFVLMHLDLNHESPMADLLARYTSLPVVQVEDNMPVRAGCVYIIPPNSSMTISHNTLYLTEPTEWRDTCMAIDFFFRSLAEDRREKAICIILSGTGSDGSLGLRAVKECGGMVMVQDPTTAQYDGMPRSAIATGLTDYTLPIEQMPEALIKYVRHFYVNGGATARPQPSGASDFVNSVLARIRAQTNHDFRAYKKSTLMRRIERRMSLHQIEQTADYLRFLQQNDDEVILLFKDLLISVTNFFRDYEAFQALDTLALTDLVQRHPPDVPLRVWVAGCATGEEAYSLAMLPIEHLSAARKNCPIQVFATDIDEQALEIARVGIYPESIAADLTPERLRRFFIHEDNHYRVTKQLRDMVVFATQNLTSDPPFSKLDLISCRNLLLYLDPAMQKRMIALFHFALNENGVLFLGNAETIGTQEMLFVPVSKKWRIYRRLNAGQRMLPDFATASADEIRRTSIGVESGLVNQRSVGTRMQQLLPDTFVPTAVLINTRYECLYIHHPRRNDQPYLHVPSGEPSQSLFEMVREELRAPVRTAVLRAFREGKTVTISTSIQRHQALEQVAITAQPFSLLGAEDLLMLHFAGQPNQPAIESQSVELPTDQAALRQLEHELAATREDLQTTIEELETSSEELKTANEEVRAMNEELQSTNEELETSKEELQSLNEELIAINSQSQNKMLELEATSNDLVNLLASTDIATLFLDLQFQIKRFTPATAQLFNLIASDIGRPISDIAQKFSDDELMRDAERVLATLQPTSKEIKAQQGRWFMRRILPYRTNDNRIEGVVITFADISDLKSIEQELARLLTREQSSRAEAEQAMRLRDIFFTAASHELKTPLTVLLGNAQAIHRRVTRTGEYSDRDLQAIQSIATQTVRVNRLINQLLDISRLENGQLSLAFTFLDLVELTRRMVKEIQPELRQHTVTLTSPQEPVRIRGDELRLEQVIQNLIRNGIKYSPDGGEVQVSIETQDGLAVFSVSDQGIGIPEEEQSQVFQRFFRARNAESYKINGLGVGLFVVHEIISRHHGTIDISSREDYGSTFTICLPLLQQPT